MISRGMDEVGETCSMIDRDEKNGIKYWSATSCSLLFAGFLLGLLDVRDDIETTICRWENNIKVGLTGTTQSSDGLL
jgi:hypothetical protein